MEESQLMIKKHSAMIQINVKELTLTQRKIINCLIYIAQKKGKQESYTTTISNLKEMCRIGKTENIDLKEQLKRLKRIDIEFNYLNKDKNEVWELISLLSEVKMIPNEGSVSFAFPPSLMEKVIRPLIYAPLDLILVSGLKSSYSIVLYEFLRDYLSAPSIPKLSIQDIRNLLGVKDNEYKLFQNFKVKVLDVAVSEVNQKTDIVCQYELIKEYGNKNSHIQFLVGKKIEPPLREGLLDREVIEETMDLFSTSKKEEVVKVPLSVISLIPDKQKTEAIFKLLNDYVDKGNDYIVSNIKYTIKKAKDNFSAYLKQALENDYAKHDREVEANARREAAKKISHIENVSKARQAAHNEYSEILGKLEDLSSDKFEEVQKRFVEIVEARGIKQEFLIESVKESLMVEAYRALYKSDAYNAKDQD